MGKADAGDAIVGSALFGLALLLFLGAFGVPFLDWLAQILLVVAGVLMIRGNLGAHPRIGGLLVILGPALFVLPGFFPAFAVTLGFVAALALVIMGALKFLGTW